MKRRNYIKFGLVLGLGIGAALVLDAQGVFAADHTDAPGTQADPAADIADFYAWHTENDTIVSIVTFAGLAEAGSDATYDPDVLYGIHIDNTGDNISDIDIWARFGQNEAGDWGLEVLNLPGAVPANNPDECISDGICGPVNTVLEGGGTGTFVWAGPAEDPFFFDFEGFLATLDTEALAFNPDNDTFAGTNVTAIVVEMDAAETVGVDNTASMWATTSRL